MISVSSTVRVNPPDEPVKLSRADVWHGLALKAENALPFVPAMTVCEVKERTDTEILREIEFRGQRFGERITLVPEKSVQFDRTFGPVMGTIRNEILEEDGDLSLRFRFDLVLEGVAPGSAAEQEYEATMKGDYLKAAEATLAATRRLVTERGPAESTAS